jgi:hypothetical protein
LTVSNIVKFTSRVDFYYLQVLAVLYVVL